MNGQVPLSAVDRTVCLVWLCSFGAGFTLIEFEKQFHMLGMNALLVEGESSDLNHLAHMFSAALAWWLADQLEFEPFRQADIDLELELNALEIAMSAEPS